MMQYYLLLLKMHGKCFILYIKQNSKVRLQLQCIPQ